jgi:hypothetical protein
MNRQWRCGTCKFRYTVDSTHELAYNDDKGGCENPKLHDKRYSRARDELAYSYDEGGWFEVGPDFGCVHWQAAKETPDAD